MSSTVIPGLPGYHLYSERERGTTSMKLHGTALASITGDGCWLLRLVVEQGFLRESPEGLCQASLGPRFPQI